MFHVAADNRFPYWVYGGQQESGSAGVASAAATTAQITFREWHPVGVEEYGYAAPDPLHPGVIYGGKVTRYDETTGDVQNVGPIVVLRTGKDRFVRTAPILFSPVDPHVLLLRDARFCPRRSNGGQSWTSSAPTSRARTRAFPRSLGVYAATPRRPNTAASSTRSGRRRWTSTSIWTGTDDGAVHVTRDGGASWTNVTPPELTAWSKVTQIDASHFDAGTAYVSVSRFRAGRSDAATSTARTTAARRGQQITRGLAAGRAGERRARGSEASRAALRRHRDGRVYVSFDDGDHWQSLR